VLHLGRLSLARKYRLLWKWLTVTNTKDHNDTELFTPVKSFRALAHHVIIKHQQNKTPLVIKQRSVELYSSTNTVYEYSHRGTVFALYTLIYLVSKSFFKTITYCVTILNFIKLCFVLKTIITSF